MQGDSKLPARRKARQLRGRDLREELEKLPRLNGEAAAAGIARERDLLSTAVAARRQQEGRPGRSPWRE